MSNLPIKRGSLRPMHSGRVPVFIILSIVALAGLFFYNLYSNSVVKNELQAENDDIRLQMLKCYKGKLEAEQKFEALTKTCKKKVSSEQETLSTLRESLKKLKSKNSNLEQDVTDANSRVADLWEQVQKLNANLSISEDSLVDLKHQNAQLARRVEALSMKNEQLFAQNTGLAASIERTSNKSSVSSKSQSVPVNKPRVSLKDLQNSGQFLYRGDNETDLNDTESIDNSTADNDLNNGDWILSNKLQLDKKLLEQEARLKKGSVPSGPRYVVQGEVTKPHDTVDESGFLDAAMAMNVGSKQAGSSLAAQNNAGTLRQVPSSGINGTGSQSSQSRTRTTGAKDGSAEVLDVSQEKVSKSNKLRPLPNDEKNDANEDYS